VTDRVLFVIDIPLRCDQHSDRDEERPRDLAFRPIKG